MKRITKSSIAVVAAGVLFAAGGVTSATAAKLISGDDIARNSIKQRNLAPDSVGRSEIKDGLLQSLQGAAGAKGDTGAQGPKGDTGAQGPKGDNGAPGAKGDNGLSGAIYRVENYKNGGGGSATVACADDNTVSQKYVAIAGGVQGGTVDTQDDGFVVNSSFPGRMDWETGAPKANRLDGWIVLGNGSYTSTLKVWALCVPAASIPVQQVDLDN